MFDIFNIERLETIVLFFYCTFSFQLKFIFHFYSDSVTAGRFTQAATYFCLHTVGKFHIFTEYIKIFKIFHLTLRIISAHVLSENTWPMTENRALKLCIGQES